MHQGKSKTTIASTSMLTLLVAIMLFITITEKRNCESKWGDCSVSSFYSDLRTYLK